MLGQADSPSGHTRGSVARPPPGRAQPKGWLGGGEGPELSSLAFTSPVLEGGVKGVVPGKCLQNRETFLKLRLL